jgi:hypothetical protein
VDQRHMEHSAMEHTALTNKYYLSSKQDTFGSFGNNEFTSVQEIFSAVIKSIKLEVE